MLNAESVLPVVFGEGRSEVMLNRLHAFLRSACLFVRTVPDCTDTTQKYFSGLAFRAVISGLVLVGLMTTGCSETPAPAAREQQLPSVQTDTSSNAGGSAGGVSGGSTAAADSVAGTEEPVKFKPLKLNARATQDADLSGKAGTDAGVDAQIRMVISQLQPLQVLLGQWRGTTRREFQNFKAVDSHEWVWDLRTNPSQPALIVQSDKSPYLKAGRLTWDMQLQQFVLTATDGEGRERRLSGDYSEAPHEITGSDDKQHRVFRLVLNEQRTGQEGEQWQLALAQQENNRYLLEVGKRRGTAAFARYDTVSTQREGTSFALSDTDYAEKACIISEGLGTMELTWKGRSYWVCCSGCKSAFEEEPDKWIARASQRASEKK